MGLEQGFGLGLELGTAINDGMEHSVSREGEGEEHDDVSTKVLLNVLFLIAVASGH